MLLLVCRGSVTGAAGICPLMPTMVVVGATVDGVVGVSDVGV